MNVAFPKSHDSIAALGKVGVASPISLGISLLDCIGSIGIDSRVSVPEIAVPLDYDAITWYQGVNNELASDNLLLLVGAPYIVKYGTASDFEVVSISLRRKPQNAVDPGLIHLIVAARSVAILRQSVSGNAPAWSVKPFTACLALNDLTTTANFGCSLPCKFLGFAGSLPCVCTFDGAKSRCSPAVSSIRNSAAAVRATTDAARLTDQLAATVWSVFLLADGANLGLWLVVHNCIIPWRLALCNLH